MSTLASSTPASNGTATLSRALLDAVATRDFESLGRLLAPGAGMRALTPTKRIEEAGAPAIVDRFKAWFGDVDKVELLHSRSGQVAERGELTYALRTVDPEGTCEITQHLFFDAREGRIHRLDILCSGFQDVQESA